MPAGMNVVVCDDHRVFTDALVSYLQDIPEIDNVEAVHDVDDALLDDRYVRRSCYALQIEQYLRHFPESQLLVLEGQDLLSGGPSWGRLFEFIGVPPLPETPTTPHANQAEARLQLRPGTRALRQRVKGSAVYRLTPHRLRSTARHFGARAHTENDAAEVTPDLRATITARLGEDMSRFAEMTGIRFSAN